MPEISFLQDLLVLFGLGIVAVVAFHRLNLPPVLGFLVTGVICGPFGFKLVDDQHGIETLAEVGLVLLLFTIGIEFSVKTFLQIKKFLLIAGGLQVVLTIGLGAAIAHYTGMPWAASAFLGMLVSLSSTAIVVRIMEHRGDLDSAHGRSGLSILIFQDLCIVPMVLITPFLGGKEVDPMEVGLLAGKAVLFLLLAATIARYLVPWFLNQVAQTKKREAFVLSIILLCLGTATATSHFGLSMALGAFIAGLIISESNFSHAALGEVLPFREVFNCLVFVSIGMMFDVRVLLSSPVTVLVALLIVVAGKTLVASTVTALMGHSLRVALLTGVALAQISEFSFVLAKLGLDVGLLDAQTNQLFLAVAIASMFLTPATLASGEALAGFLERILPAVLTRKNKKDTHTKEPKPKDHVIIVGYGLSGQTLATALAEVGVSYVIIDQDPNIVKAERAKGTPIIYGDASRPEVLHHAAGDTARVVALTVSDANTVLRSAELAKRMNPNLHIVARARFMEEVKPLVAVGAHQVIPEELVGSLEILSRVLQQYLLPNEVIDKCTQKLKNEHGKNWQMLFEAHHPGAGLPCIPCDLSVEVRRVVAGSSVADKDLLNSNLRPKTGVTVVAIQKADGTLTLNPKWSDRMQVGDSVILLGQREQLAAAASFFTVAAVDTSTQVIAPVANNLLPEEKSDVATGSDAHPNSVDDSRTREGMQEPGANSDGTEGREET